jgi:hypothetical protein
MKHRIKVVMLPTEDITGIVLHSTGLDPFYTNSVKDRVDNLRAVKDIGGVSQYLYATISQDVEPIKKGDYAIHKTFGLGIIKNVYGQECFVTLPRNIGDGSVTTPWERNIPNIKKVIASTNTKLVQKKTVIGKDEINNIYNPVLLPQLQQSLLKEFIANPDGKFEVEYMTTSCCGKSHIYESECQENCEHYPIAIIKLNQDNTVNITSVENKIYNAKEVKILIKKYALEEHLIEGSSSKILNWIKENL